MKKNKVLFIAYAFPPLGGSGVQRSLKFVKYLPIYGWDPVVVTVNRNTFLYNDDSLSKDINLAVKTIRIDEKENLVNNTNISEVLTFIQSVIKDKSLIDNFLSCCLKNKNLFYDLISVPDKRIIWAINVIKYLLANQHLLDVDLIYTTSDPYSTSLIGYELTKKFNIPWVSDYRDEWTNHQYMSEEYKKHELKFKISRTLEEKCLDASKKILTVSDISKDNYIKFFKIQSEKIHVITNGYDEKDFRLVTDGSNEKFLIVHNGLFYKDVREPFNFLFALSRMIKNNAIDKRTVQVIFTQENFQIKINSFCKKLKIDDVVFEVGYLAHVDSLQLASMANVLLLVVGSGEEKKSVYTGKVFEYLRLEKPILALAPRGGVVDDLMIKTDRGRSIEYDDITAIEKYLLQQYKIWLSGKKIQYQNRPNIECYERKNLTRKLADVFDSVIQHAK